MTGKAFTICIIAFCLFSVCVLPAILAAETGDSDPDAELSDFVIGLSNRRIAGHAPDASSQAYDKLEGNSYFVEFQQLNSSFSGIGNVLSFEKNGTITPWGRYVYLDLIHNSFCVYAPGIFFVCRFSLINKYKQFLGIGIFMYYILPLLCIVEGNVMAQ